MRGVDLTTIRDAWLVDFLERTEDSSSGRKTPVVVNPLTPSIPDRHFEDAARVSFEARVLPDARE